MTCTELIFLFYFSTVLLFVLHFLVLHLRPPAHPPMGQLLLLHICCSWTSPTQSLPPCWGSGLLQTRVRSRIPPAQVTVQADHGDHGLHRPSTVGGEHRESMGKATYAGRAGRSGPPHMAGKLGRVCFRGPELRGNADDRFRLAWFSPLGREITQVLRVEADC